MTSNETPKPSNKIALRWTGNGKEYLGTGGAGPAVILDGSSAKGPSPMDALLYAVAGCMALDVQHILEASRVPMTALEVEVEGERAPDPPKFFTKLRLIYRVEGPQDEHQAKLERAVALSKEKFCSVLHTLRPDIEYLIEIHRV
jgi:putative redox protein